MIMIFNVEINNPEEANKFLRSLWAEFRKEFGKCAWNYMPHKIGETQTILLGLMDINLPEGVVQVNIYYHRKGTIKDIGFIFPKESIDENRYKEIDNSFKTIINTAKNNLHKTLTFSYKTAVSTIYKSLGYYRSGNFVIHSSSENKFNFSITTSGYDDIDAETNCNTQVISFLDLLSVETNSAFWGDKFVDQLEQKIDREEIFVEDMEWIDDYPIISEKLRLSKAGKTFLDLIAKDELNKDKKLFLKACNHFHTARKYDAQVHDLFKCSSTQEVEQGVYQLSLEERDNGLSMAFRMGASHREIASVLYISALEVASSIGIEDAKNCTECGQKLYNIRSRVSNMIENHFNPSLAKDFKGYYDKRSNYLHAGELLFNYSYIGTTIPQLDPSDPTGCKVHSGIPLLNLREYTSFCLRKILQSLLVKEVVDDMPI